MSMTLTEILIDRKEIDNDHAERIDSCFFDQVMEVDSPDDSMAFIVIDSLMTLLVYLAPVVAFGYMVAPVIARLLRMPLS
jgi:hypothetical protein